MSPPGEGHSQADGAECFLAGEVSKVKTEYRQRDGCPTFRALFRLKAKVWHAQNCDGQFFQNPFKVKRTMSEPSIYQLKYPGVDDLDTVTRVIPKNNGDLVTLFASGAAVVCKTGAAPVTHRSDGTKVTYSNGRLITTIARQELSPENRPLNVASNAHEKIGRALSNFAPRPFILNGERFQSVESWYQGLKWPDQKKRDELAKLDGRTAKKEGRGAARSLQFQYRNRDYVFGGEEHHQLIREAIKASLEQNPQISEAFSETYPRPIVHNTGRPERSGTALPGATFARMLEEIRLELIDSRRGTDFVTSGHLPEP
jgi:predicted NAD-dependent protein-ADP-ribosyltransferase YbiA (DUF1768 family)